MIDTAPRSRGFHYLAAIVSTGTFLVLVRLLPSLGAANDSELVLKCASEIILAAHAAAWGPMQIVFAAVPGLVLTLASLWKRDLWICIIAHFLTDAAGLLSPAAAMGNRR